MIDCGRPPVCGGLPVAQQEEIDALREANQRLEDSNIALKAELAQERRNMRLAVRSAASFTHCALSVFF